LKYNIPDGTLLWNAYVLPSQTLDMGEKKSKDFLERDSFAGLRSVNAWWEPIDNCLVLGKITSQRQRGCAIYHAAPLS
jgi:hypothetical protein